MAQDPSAPSTLAFIQVRLTRIYPEQIRQCLAALTDEQIWWRPHEHLNSIGNLVVHLSGSLNHYLNRNLGGFPYARDRDAEFAERRTIPRDELLAMFDGMVANGEKTLASLTPERRSGPSAEPERYNTLLEDLLSILTHVSNHAGQIVWITKMLHEGAVDEVWIRTHKNLGGWTPTRE
ncbi:MAG: DinB family protein [Acidobacteriota bacterium]